MSPVLCCSLSFSRELPDHQTRLAVTEEIEETFQLPALTCSLLIFKSGFHSVVEQPAVRLVLITNC